MLQKIQAELKAPKGQTNKFGGYQYRSCEDILEAVKPILAAHEMVLTLSDEVKSVENVPQMVITDESTKPKKKTLTLGTLSYVEATATIFKGEFVIATVTAQAGIDTNKAGMDVAQCFGASSSYARKYALNGLFCIDDTKDADSAEYQGEPEKQHVNKHEDSSKKQEQIKNDFKSTMLSVTTIAALDEEMKKCEAAWNKWPEAWIQGMTDLYLQQEEALGGKG